MNDEKCTQLEDIAIRVLKYNMDKQRKAQLVLDKYFMRLCKETASASKDPSTKVGAIIVGPDHEIRSTGWNGFARKVNDTPERWNNRPTKYQYVVHAERNAIYNAARVGTPLKGCTMYVRPLFVCNVCADAIIQSGIIEVVMMESKAISQPIWEEVRAISQSKLDEAGIKIRVVGYINEQGEDVFYE